MTAGEALHKAIDVAFNGALGDLDDGYDRILAALDAAGFVVVPKVPTRNMLMQAMSGGVGADARTIWTAMLAARPG